MNSHKPDTIYENLNCKLNDERMESIEIKEGSFITTMKVRLFGPGVDMNADANLGGPKGPKVKLTK
jgi:D-Tyr-tRNAtyr deacylase